MRIRVAVDLSGKLTNTVAGCEASSGRFTETGQLYPAPRVRDCAAPTSTNIALEPWDEVTVKFWSEAAPWALLEMTTIRPTIRARTTPSAFAT